MTEQNVKLVAIDQKGIIPIYINGGSENRLVSARELHEFLEIGKRFTTWINDRIKKYGFVEGQDFLPLLGETYSDAAGGRPSTDYAFTLDAAKELAMVQNNERGREARKYFIEVEKEYVRMLEDKVVSFREIDQTSKELISLKANTVFLQETAKAARALVSKYTAYGIDKSEAVIIVHAALSRGEDPDLFVEDKIRVLRAQELQRKRDRIYVRAQRIGTLLRAVYPEMEGPYEEAWHLISNELIFEVGTKKSLQKRHDEDKVKYEKINAERGKGVKKQPCPGYLDYIEEGNLYKQAEKVANKLIKKYSRLFDKIVPVVTEEAAVLDATTAV